MIPSRGSYHCDTCSLPSPLARAVPRNTWGIKCKSGKHSECWENPAKPRKPCQLARKRGFCGHSLLNSADLKFRCRYHELEPFADNISARIWWPHLKKNAGFRPPTPLFCLRPSHCQLQWRCKMRLQRTIWLRTTIYNFDSGRSGGVGSFTSLLVTLFASVRTTSSYPKNCHPMRATP